MRILNKMFFTLFFLIQVLMLFLLTSPLEGTHGSVKYPFTSDPIDVVIPAISKDLPTLELCIKGIKRYGKNIRRIIVVSPTKLTDNAEWFDESNYPFTRNEVAYHLLKGDEAAAESYLTSPQSRFGWYYQQLLKLYAPFTIPDISPNVLILDSDTIFLKPVTFMSANGAGLYNFNKITVHKPYLIHAQHLIPGFKTQFLRRSGICHHMLFQKPVLEDLFATVERAHGKEFWQAFCECVASEELGKSGASEYEIYYNFVFSRTNLVRNRSLHYIETGFLDKLPMYKRQGYDYLSSHDYLRK